MNISNIKEYYDATKWSVLIKPVPLCQGLRSFPFAYLFCRIREMYILEALHDHSLLIDP